MTALISAVAVVVLLPLGWWSLKLLLGRCRLVLNGRALQYEEFVAGVRNGRACRQVAAADVSALRIGDQQRGGVEVLPRGAAAFFIRVPVGGSAFSLDTVSRLKDQWSRDLGLPRQAAGAPYPLDRPS
jgi:hypothetical protein